MVQSIIIFHLIESQFVSLPLPHAQRVQFKEKTSRNNSNVGSSISTLSFLLCSSLFLLCPPSPPSPIPFLFSSFEQLLNHSQTEMQSRIPDAEI